MKLALLGKAVHTRQDHQPVQILLDPLPVYQHDGFDEQLRRELVDDCL
ncbi:hypothetical protein [Brevibacillus brevis]